MPRATSIANLLIRLGNEAGKPLTPLAVQKLLYFVHGHALSRLGRGAVDEPFQAWEYGPVVPSLYRWLRQYQGRKVTREISDPTAVELETTDPELAGLVRSVFSVYGGLDGLQLTKMSHAPGGAWAQAVAPYGDDVPLDLEISDEAIREYFARREAA